MQTFLTIAKQRPRKTKKMIVNCIYEKIFKKKNENPASLPANGFLFFFYKDKKYSELYARQATCT